jgi:autotransporter-associated beta strand protein
MFTRNIGTGAGEIYWNARGGFSAYGGPLTVRLEGGITLNWTDMNTGFRGQLLQLGSSNATHEVNLSNDIGLYANRAVYVWDNTNTVDDIGRMSGTIANGDGSARAFYKRGNGTLWLSGTNTYSGYTYLDWGALRAWDGEGLPANSLLYFNYNGTTWPNVLETSGSFTRNIGNAAGEVYWYYSGGFAAYGGPLTVNLESGATLTWSSATLGFRGQYLHFGSRTANEVVTFENNIDLVGDRYLCGHDNPFSTSDYARITGVLANGATASRIYKVGDGLIELAAKNTYTLETRIYAGELRVNGTITNGTHFMTVSYGSTGGALSGTGMVRDVRVYLKGVLYPGINGAGVFNAWSRLHFYNGGILEWNLMPASTGNAIRVLGNVRLDSTWLLRLNDRGGSAQASDQFDVITYTGWMETLPGICQVDVSRLNPALWDTSGIQVVHDPVRKRVYLTGLQYREPSITISDAIVTEGDAGTTNAVFTVRIDTPANATVNYATRDGTALAGQDYVAAGGLLTFTPAVTSHTVTVTVNGDTQDEWLSEQFYVDLLTPTNARLARASGIGHIRDDDTAMTYWMKVSLPGYTRPGTLTNFPVAVKFNESIPGFNYDQFASITGGDLRFVNSNHTAFLNHEIERWDRNGDSIAWVQVPRLSGTNMYFWAYWGDPDKATPPPYTANGAVWTEDFLAVWHLNATNATGRFIDSSPNNYHGINQGCIDADGIVGGGQNFDGLRRINITGTSYAPTLAFQRRYTIQFWFKGADITANMYFIDFASGRIITALNVPELGRLGYYDSNVWRGSMGSSVNDGQWHHVAYAFNGNDTTCWVYIDGQPAGVLPYQATVGIGGNARIGSDNAGNGTHFDGLMDEVRICKGDRPADWIWASYANQNESDGFVSFDPINDNATDLRVASRPASNIRTRTATLNGVLVHDGGVPARVYVCYGTTDGGTSTSAWNQVVLLGSSFASLTSVPYAATGLNPRTAYHYRYFATNTTGSSWSSRETFQTWGERYVSMLGNNTVGTNWTTAYTSLQTALNTAPAVSNEIFVAGGAVRGRFVLTAPLSCSTPYVRIIGGHQATAGAPGTNNPVTWPTIITRNTASYHRLMDIAGVTDGWFYGITFTNGHPRGASHPSGSGGAVLVTDSPNVTFDTCTFTSNRCYLTTVNGGNIYGGAVCSQNSALTMVDCVVTNNLAYTLSSSNLQHGNGGGVAAVSGSFFMRRSIVTHNVARGDYLHAQNMGGGLYINAAGEVTETVIVKNDSFDSNNYKPARGDGMYVGAAATVRFRNCLITGNYGLGMWLAGGNSTFENCTIARNQTHGIYRIGGNAWVNNSILWQNTDDVYENVIGSVRLYNSIIGNGDNYQIDGCTDVDPIFADINTFHLSSPYGQYTNGFFSGGSWVNGVEFSPAIDAGHSASPFSREPDPNGGRVNLGAYGDSPVASKSRPMAVRNLAPTGISPISAILRGQLDQIGSPGVDIWFYWGPTDGGANFAAWSNQVYVSRYNAPATFWSKIEGLVNLTTYYYRVYAANSGGGAAWATPTTNFIAQPSPPDVINRGVVNDATAAITLQGELLSDGGAPTRVFICWGVSEAGTASTAAWDRVENLGILTGAFERVVAAVPGENYFFRCYATNAAGSSWSDPAIDFGAFKVLYVDTLAAGSGQGHNWANAITNLAAALDACSSTKTNRLYLKGGPGGMFQLFQQLDLTRSRVTLRGGHAGDGYPGTRNPRLYPTVLYRYPANNIRIVSIRNVSDVALESVTITSGFSSGNGAGVEILNSDNIRLTECVISSNTCSSSSLYTYGGGVYAFNSFGVISNCWIGRNRMQAIVSSYQLFGAGVHLEGGAWTILDTVLFYNTARSSGSYGYCFGGGLSVNSGSHWVRNGLIVQNYCWGNLDNVTYSRGDGVHHTAGSLTLENCTIAGNKGEGVRGTASTTLRDSILWRNERDLTNSAVMATFNCNIGNGEQAGINGNISANPWFEQGFYLAAGSACIDAGSRSASAAGLSGYTTRTNGSGDTGTVDLGYHHSGVHPLPRLYVSPTGNNANAGTSWGAALRTVTRALSAAEVGTYINVAAGTYDQSGGETFPLLFDTAGVHLRSTNRNTTIFLPPGNPTEKRVMYIPDLSFGKVEGFALCNGYAYGPGSVLEYGGGVNVLNATDLQIANCVIATNVLNGHINSLTRGAGISLRNTSATITDTLIEQNSSYVAPGSWNGTIQGGGVFVDGGSVSLNRSIIRNNDIYLASYQTQQGAGLAFVSGGPHSMTNCLVSGNNARGYTRDNVGDGVYANGLVNIVNSTIANNGTNSSSTFGPNGLWAQGTVVVSNSILWGNGDEIMEGEDFAVKLFYSNIEDGDREGINGCTSVSPNFVDEQFFHLRSQYGHYINGFFSGGSWSTHPTITSDLIDRGNPNLETTIEPVPNGGIVNMGAYGNTPVASKSPPLTVINRPVNGVATNAANLNGLLVRIGSPRVDLWFYYGATDGSNNPLSWANSVYVGRLNAPGTFRRRVTGLINGTLYHYRAFASNEAGATAWAPATETFTAGQAPPEVENEGVLNESGPTVTLRGRVTSNGGQTPQVYVVWGHQEGNLVSTTSWQNVRSLGLQDGAFQTDITTLPASNYFYTCLAINAYGTNWAAPSLPFGRFAFRYVAATATGRGTGYSWTDAYTSVNQALRNCAIGRTNIIYVRGQTFRMIEAMQVTNSHVRVYGGYQGITGTPGVKSGNTVLTNRNGELRILWIGGVTNVLFDSIQFGGGMIGGFGGGAYVENAGAITFNNCVFNNNKAVARGGGLALNNVNNIRILNSLIANNTVIRNSQYSYGGGIYADNCTGMISNSVVEINLIRGWVNYDYCYGGGVFLNSGNLAFRDTAIRYNRLESTAYGRTYGGGVFVNYNTHSFTNCVIANNHSEGSQWPYAGGVYISQANANVPFANCTIVGNQNQGIWRNAGTVTVRDSILWKNTDDIYGTVTLQNSNIENGDAGTDCFSENPKFVRGLYLAPSSPCHGKGSRTVAAAGLTGYTTSAGGGAYSGTVSAGYHYKAGMPEHLDNLYVNGQIDPETGYVGNDSYSGDEPWYPFRRITRALASAIEGTYIHVVATNYPEPGTYPLTVRRYGIRIIGTNANTTILDAGNASRVLNLYDHSFGQIEGLQIRRGAVRDRTGSGGGMMIQFSHETTFKDCIISNNLSELHGGGIYAYNNRGLTFDNCQIVNNQARNAHTAAAYNFGAGIYSFDTTGIMTNTLVARNVAFNQNNAVASRRVYGGGAAFNNSSWDLVRTVIQNNFCTGTASDGATTALYGGGVFVLGTGVHNFRNCLLAGNTVTTPANTLNSYGGNLSTGDGSANFSFGGRVHFEIARWSRATARE